MRPPESWSKARVTLGFAAVIASAWILIFLLNWGGWASIAFGFIPARISLVVASDVWLAPVWLTPLTATLVHANVLHLAFILLMLAVCGRPTEAVIGPFGLGILYLLGAYAAAGVYYLVDPSQMAPWVSGSGSVAAVLGAFSILFGRNNKVKIANPRLARWLNALWMMAAWVAINVVIAVAIGHAGIAAVVAIATANMSGFLVGVALANPLLLIRYRKA